MANRSSAGNSPKKKFGGVVAVQAKQAADKAEGKLSKRATASAKPAPTEKKTERKTEKKVEHAIQKLAKAATSAKRGAEKILKETAPKRAKSASFRRAKKVEPIVEEPIVNIHELTSEQTDKMIKTFRKASAAAEKNIPKKRKVSYSNFLHKGPSSGKKYMVDLRVHTPGTVGYFTSGGVEPGPALVRLAKVKGLDMIGLTDFYSSSYIDIIHQTVPNPSIAIVPGFDLCTVIGSCRDVHITCLFPENFRSADLKRVLDELGVPDYAAGRSDFIFERPFGETLKIVEAAGGVVIPSQLDKTPYRQLAIAPLVEIYGIRTFDLVHPENTEFFKERWPDGEFVFFSFSNSTALAQIGSRVASIKLSSPTFEGVSELCERRIS